MLSIVVRHLVPWAHLARQLSYTRTSIRFSPFRGSIYLLTYRRYRLLYRETAVNNIIFTFKSVKLRSIRGALVPKESVSFDSLINLFSYIKITHIGPSYIFNKCKYNILQFNVYFRKRFALHVYPLPDHTAFFRLAISHRLPLYPYIHVSRYFTQFSVYLYKLNFPKSP